MVMEAVALLQNPLNTPHCLLHVTSLSPLYARYMISADTVPAANITYVSIWSKKKMVQARDMVLGRGTAV